MLGKFTAASQAIENKWVDLASVYSKKPRFLRLSSAWEAAALPLSYTREAARRLPRKARAGQYKPARAAKIARPGFNAGPFPVEGRHDEHERVG